MLLLVGVLAALLGGAALGPGQVVDAAMVDGTSLLMQMIWAFHGQGQWADGRETNLLDGGAPYYDTYTCADGRHVAVGALEPQFYAQLLDGLGLDPAALPDRDDRAAWPTLRARITEAFSAHTRDHWVDGVRRHRCLRDAGAGARRGRRRSACRCPGHRRRSRRRSAGRPGTPVLADPGDAARATRRTGERRLRAGRLGLRRPASDERKRRWQSQTLPTPLSLDRRCPAAALMRLGGRCGQADGASSASRFRVRFGSTGMPGPVVVETVTFLR